MTASYKPYDVILYKGKRYVVLEFEWDLYLGGRIKCLTWLNFKSYMKTLRIPQSSIDDGTFRTEADLDHSVRHKLRLKTINSQYATLVTKERSRWHTIQLTNVEKSSKEWSNS